jgi:hypothetical protein
MGRFGILLAALPIAAAVIWVATSKPLKKPLWPNSRFTELDRQRSLLRGLEFIYATASNPKRFDADGEDLLWCFYSLSATAADSELKNRAWRMGQERAREWRRVNTRVAPDAEAAVIWNLAYGGLSAGLLDVRDDGLKAELQTASRRHTAEEYLHFDPTKEPPPGDVPKDCARCKSTNPRGAKVCRKCGAGLQMTSRYEILCDALISAHTAARSGVWLGGSYEDVAQWVPKMRPYPTVENAASEGDPYVTYAVTHVVYTLNDYTLYKLRPEWLPQEYQYLKSNLKKVVMQNDPEMLGELMDTLRSFGVDESDPLMQAGVEFLISRQNADGSWGEAPESDSYTRYHTTWTAMNGVMQYAWRGERTIFPEGLRLIQADNR